MFFVLKLSEGVTKPFPLENPGRFVLIVEKPQTNQDDSDGEETARKTILTILISGGSSNPVTIVVRRYQYGDSVAKFVNLCDHLSISIKEKKSDKVLFNLEPLNSMFFVWPNLVSSRRELECTIGSSNYSYDIKLTKSSNERLKFEVELAANSPMIQASPQHSNVSDVDDASENDAKNLLLHKRKSKFGIATKVGEVPKTTIEISCVSYIEGMQRLVGNYL